MIRENINNYTYHPVHNRHEHEVEVHKALRLDGSYIRYRVIGKGPSLVVVHGMFQTVSDFNRLCNDFASDFTVHAIYRNRLGNRGIQGWITICKKT